MQKISNFKRLLKKLMCSIQGHETQELIIYYNYTSVVLRYCKRCGEELSRNVHNIENQGD